jgi:eukaryotic-like serine/threonine-protein kinase
MIGKKVGNYEIKSKLGEGGMGAVYLGEHPMIGKRVAIKVLLEEFASNEVVVSRFFNEAKAVNDIGHQNIVDIIDFGKIPTEDGSSQMVYFVMELLNGESLADRIKRLPLTTAETRHVIEQCCDALNASHAKGIVHRDLKPDNIFLTVRGQDKAFVKILDFGIAKLTGAGGANNKTQTGTVIGTPHYMSPEQCAGKGLIDHRSDIYSLGCVMYELATGHLPFPGEGFGDILIAHLIREPPKPSEVKPDIDPVLEQVIMKAMLKDREQRFASMAEMGAAVAGKGASGADFKFQPLFADEASKANKLLQDVPGGKAGFNTFDKKPATDPPEEKKKITTLSGAASEMAPGGRSKAQSIAAVAAVMLVIGGVGGYFALRGNSTPAVTPPAVVVTPPPPVEKQAIEIKVNSVPPGAMVVRADQAEGPRLTPAVFRLKEGDASFDVSIKLAGYKVQTRTIHPDVSKTIEIVLAKEEAPVPVAAPPPPGTPPVVKKKKRVESPSDDDMKTLAPVF